MALDQIVADKRIAVAERMRDRPLAGFRSDVGPTTRDFAGALRAPRTSFVFECKKASPSRGLIRADFDPTAIGNSYAPFADAISVLTDTPYFQGSFEHLRAVREAAPQPILCKDFVVDPYQIYEARWHGADAVLLMCSVLDDATLQRCLTVTRELSMGALVEVHDADELGRALRVDADVIGINNRNLKTLQTDLATTRALAPQVPADKVSICESGIFTHDEVRELRGQVHAFLVGTSLMREPDLDEAVRRLVFGRLKICGFTDNQQAHAAHAAGATHGGVMLWPQSKRAVSVEQARAVVDGVGLRWVGVFVDAPTTDIALAVETLSLAAVQLHGDESKHTIVALRAELPASCAIWKAHRVREDEAVDGRGADRLLLDTYRADAPGGTGKRFDWDLVRNHPLRAELVVSGGIDADNAAEADALGAWALDLSSGVERSPGDKDPALVDSLLSALRGRGKADA